MVSDINKTNLSWVELTRQCYQVTNSFHTGGSLRCQFDWDCFLDFVLDILLYFLHHLGLKLDIEDGKVETEVVSGDAAAALCGDVQERVEGGVEKVSGGVVAHTGQASR